MKTLVFVLLLIPSLVYAKVADDPTQGPKPFVLQLTDAPYDLYCTPFQPGTWICQFKKRQSVEL